MFFFAFSSSMLLFFVDHCSQIKKKYQKRHKTFIVKRRHVETNCRPAVLLILVTFRMRANLPVALSL